MSTPAVSLIDVSTYLPGEPINLDRAVSDRQLQAGDVVVMAAFAHAGDFAGAAAVRWGGRD